MKHVVRTLGLALTLLIVCCLVAVDRADATVIVDTFPHPDGEYELQNTIMYTIGTFDTEIVSMSLSGASGGEPLGDIGGGLYDIDSFFDVFTELRVGGAASVTLSYLNVPAELTAQRLTGTGQTGTFATEIVSMSLSGNVPGLTGPVEVRVDPSQQSAGRHTIEDIGSGQYHIDSFFDVFTELRVGGVGFPASGPMEMSYEMTVPEPATLSLLGMGVLAMLCFGGRAMWRRRRK